ncbi:serine/threonine-protein phosphatase 7 long form homolog isoform X1 [Sesamum indicum]|uniref:Serine/threonine-protein phosphatase 7 long form homolog isoform X1 n=1 Tax=Sesamum indicum TaxID=4182 RepID=A0A6I9U4R0_SESIN|nr:serine/threonine-protein phosphatase 7 long form homolog isoform X1 [Sesamum indicum]XP_011095577.1 serine/threonine-protein phosphatase 7 long form homolog isoform X1 [Sesamum indicum]
MDSGLGHTLHPGPIDDSVLTLQDHHRSTDIWDGKDFEPLTCRRCDGHFWRLGTLDPRVQQMMLKAGFYGVYKAGRMRLDHALITALVERWRPETHTFHLPVGEATVTLQDISVLWGLPVDGDPITGVDTNRSMDEWQDICNELLGFRPPPEDFDRGRLKIRCLQERFKTLPDGASEDTVQFYARAYILQLLGGQLLSDMSNNKVKLMYLPLLRDFEAAGRLSWGGAVLACLYRALCRATKAETSDICGPLVLLQIWAWERVPFIRPGRLAPRQQPPPDMVSGDHPLPAAPYGSRWNVGFKLETVGTHVLVLYRDQLDNMKDDQFVWEPYPADVLASLPGYCVSGKRIWQTVAPLICFDVVEFHHPDRVLRQFGQQQTVPAICDTIPDIHLTDRRGRQNYDWAHHHRQFVDMWTERCARVVTAPPVDGPMDQNDPYMLWYRRITRLLIGNPATRPNTGYQGVGGAMEAMAQSLQKIYHRATDAMHEGYEVSGEDVLREIQDICAYSLRAAHEDHRLTVRPDFRAPSPAGSPFAPPKVQRGRPRKRGGLACGRATESRKRVSYAPTMSTSSDVSHSLKPSTILQAHVGELPDTPQTWDSSLCAPDFQDASDPNTMQLDPEATDTKLALSLDFAETTNPIIDALGKIRDICAFALRMSNGNQTMISEHDMIPDDPKTKRCKPRRRAGVSGYLVGANSGVNSYFPCTSGASSPTPSVSLGPNGSPSRPQDCHEQAVEPLVAPLSRDSPLPELQDNLQLEMIELDTITGSREASPSPVNPSMLDIPCEPPGDQDSVLPLTDVKSFSQEDNVPMVTDSADTPQPVTVLEENGGGTEVLPPIPAPHATTPCLPAPVQPDYGDPTKFNESPSSPLVDVGASQGAQLEPEVSTVRPDPNEVVTDVNGPETKSIPGPPVLEPQGAQTLTPSDLASPMTEDSKLSSQQDDKEIPEPSPVPQVSFSHPVSDETMRVDGPDTDSTGGGDGKRKEQETNKVSDSSPNPETVHNHGKSPLKSWHEGASQVTETDTATARDDVQRKYKRQRRSAPKQR